MGHHKLEHFAENLTFANLFQVSFETLQQEVSERGPILDHKYFLITTDELVKADGDDIDTHVFDKTVYLEFND